MASSVRVHPLAAERVQSLEWQGEDTTLADAWTLKRLSIDVVIVHGSGAAITDWLKRLDKPAVFVDGLRVTDPETMDVVTMTLAGKVNKDLVGQIQALGGRAIGLSGVDGGMLRGVY